MLSNDNKVRVETIKYFINGKTVVINRPINKIYPIEPVKQTSVDIQPKFIDDTNICQIETTSDTLIRYTAVVYMYICIGSVVEGGGGMLGFTHSICFSRY